VATGEDMVFESIMRALSQGRNRRRDRKSDTQFRHPIATPFCR
jgi:hypothetical protein